MGLKLVSEKNSNLVPIMELEVGRLAIVEKCPNSIDVGAIVIRASGLPPKIVSLESGAIWGEIDADETLCRYLEVGEQIEITD